MNEKLLYSSGALRCGDLDRKEIQKRGDISVYIADSLCCTVEANTAL